MPYVLVRALLEIIHNYPSNAVCQNGQITCNSGYYLSSSVCAAYPTRCATCYFSSYCTSFRLGYKLISIIFSDNYCNPE